MANRSRLGKKSELHLGKSAKRLTINDVKVGMKVYWHDPDHGICSRWDKVAEVYDADGEVDDDTIVLLESGTEVFAHELS